MGKIDWLRRACDALNNVSHFPYAQTHTDYAFEKINAYANYAQACIAMHNAEREQERQTIVQVTPMMRSMDSDLADQFYANQRQTQPFDCKEAADSITNILSNTGGLEWSHVRDYLRDYCRSLNIQVANDPS